MFIKINGENGCIINDYAGANTLGFLAKIPTTAKFDSIKLDGVFLEDLSVPTLINYHKERVEGDYRVLATVFFPAEAPSDLIDRISSYMLQEFDVYFTD